MTVLFDGNVLVALTVVGHVHHEAVETWFTQTDEAFATCPVTQGTLVRFLVRAGVPAGEAVAVLTGLTGDARHEFWPDDLEYGSIDFRGVIGHRQVTDAYLAQLARNRGGQLLTLDGGLSQLHEDVAVAVPTARP